MSKITGCPPVWSTKTAVFKQDSRKSHFFKRSPFPLPPDWEGDLEDDAPRSPAEADAENARMELLMDRITARCAREGIDESEHFDRIYREERDRLIRQAREVLRGEKE